MESNAPAEGSSAIDISIALLVSKILTHTDSDTDPEHR
jgi:hypothetical protein